MTPLSQRTMPQGNHLLGTSHYYIHAKGCVITCLAMILGVSVDEVNEKLKGVSGFAPDATGQNCLVIWKKIEQAFPGVHVNRFPAYDNNQVLSELAAGNKVLVESPSDPIGLPGGKHWTVYLGNHELLDSWTGARRPTSDFPNPSGYAVISGSWQDLVSPSLPVPFPPVDPNVYGGLDLNNKESVKIAIDVWHDVSNGVYVRSDEYVAFKDKVVDALGIDRASNLDAIIGNIKALKDNFKEQVTSSLPASQHVEGEGAPIVPVVTMVNLPQHEKDALLNQLQAAAAEVKKLLGL